MERRLINFFYQWHRFEAANNISIIDFDLLQQGNANPGSFHSRQEVKQILSKLILEYSGLPLKDPFIEAKLEACLFFLKALMGEQIAFSEYVEKTMVIRPRLISKPELTQQLQKTKEAYKAVGYDYTKRALNQFNRDHQLSKKDIELQFLEFRDRTVPKVITWLGIKAKLDYRVSFDDRDEYWMSWISTDEQGKVHLRYNLHKRHRWTRGITEFLVFHEICAHAIQTTLWKQAAKQGRIPKAAGLTMVFTPEQFCMEGIAEALCYFYPENPFSDFGWVSLHVDHLYWLVWNNAHIMANEGRKLSKIQEFVLQYLPTLTKEEIAKRIEEKTNDPVGRTYQYIYGIALYYHKRIAEKLTKEERRQFVLDNLTHVYSPETLLQKYGITESSPAINRSE